MPPLTPDELFPAHVTRLRSQVDAALAACGYDMLVVHSGFLRNAFLDDQAYPFRANPHFAWIAPLQDAPGCLLALRPGSVPRLVFPAVRDYWHVPPALPDEAWLAEFDVEVVAAAGDVWHALPEGGRRVFVGEPPPDLPATAFAAINPEPLLRRLHHARAVKTDYEILCMRLASQRAAGGHRAAEAAFRAGESEFGILLAYLQGCGQRENELPYGPIVALGSHAATLHYQSLDRIPPPASRTLLIDAGASFRGYASDVTRTWAAAPGPFADLVAELDQAQQSLAAAVRPGIDWRDLHLTAHRQVGEILRTAGIIHIDADEAVDRGLTAVFLPHGLGHLLGLQTHDVGGFLPDPEAVPVPTPPGHPSLRLTRVLEEGFVVTVEPGIYFIDLLLDRARSGPLAGCIDWQLVDALRPWGGIRIEDNLHVTATGAENLTRPALAAAGVPAR